MTEKICSLCFGDVDRYFDLLEIASACHNPLLAIQPLRYGKYIGSECFFDALRRSISLFNELVWFVIFKTICT